MSDLEGVMLSDYLLLQCISKGGVADVYRARQNGEGNYEVAVKIFRPGYAQREAFRTYFMTEAEKVGQFDHPHILPLLEFGEGEGLLYVVMPFIKTGTLEDLLQRVGGKFSAMQALPIMQQLCSAVQYAHECEVIHGDIKPSNVFVGADGRMLLADFGIARGYDDSQQSLTRVGWGSAEYAAPEQSLGVLRRSSDIYSLGVLLFRILTGSPPFTGQTPVEVLLKHVRQEPPSARILATNVSDAVDGVLHTALQKRSDDRFASAEAFSNALATAVAIAPVASPVARSVPQPAHTRLLPVADPQTPIPTSNALPASVETPTPPGSGFPAPPSPTEPPDSEQAPRETSAGSDITEVHQKNSLVTKDQPGTNTAQFWTVDPAEWSPISNEQAANVGSIPMTANEYLSAMPAVQAEPPSAAPAPTSPLPPEKPASGDEQASRSRLKKLLPIIVVALLLLGLLGALVSPFILPKNTPGTSTTQTPASTNPTATTGASATASPETTGTATPGAKKTPTVTGTAVATQPAPRPTPAPPGPVLPAFSCTSGSIALDGSANFQPAMQQLTGDYDNQCANSANFNLGANGSKSSLDSLASGNIDLAYSDLASAGRPGLVDYQVAGLIFAVIVNSDTGVTRLTTAQFQGIYTGAITNWSQVGGTNESITIITRPSDSAIRAIFQAYVLKGRAQTVDGTSLWFDSTGAAAQKVVDTSGAISYIPVGAVPASGALSIAINGISPTAGAVASGAYPFWSVEHLYSNHAASGLALSFISFCFTSTGTGDIANNSAVSIRRISPAALSAHLAGPTV